MAIDPTARVADGARLDESVEVGPFCIIGPDVELKAGVRLLSHVSILGVTTIGGKTTVYPFASLGTPPQSVHYKGGPTRLVVGASCEVREGVTVNTGTENGGGVTTVGDRCFLMVGSHVGHDCHVGHNVTFANNAVLGGHVTVEDFTFIGGNTAVHQYVRIGEGAMIGGLSGISGDIIPFGFASGQIADLVGLNVVGLQRRGLTRAQLHILRRAYRSLFFAGGRFAERLEAAAREFGQDPAAGKIITFIREGGKRSLTHPRARHTGGGQGDDAA